MSTCPAGHTSAAEDYCDVCGVAIGSAVAASAEPAQPAPTVAATHTACPHCQAANPVDALFCEACGYDFTTGTLPRPLSADPNPLAPGENPAPAIEPDWVVEVWIDPDWYADQGASEPMPSPGLPTVVAIRNTSVLIGRASNSRNISPDIDLSSDSGVSRRHAQLSTDGTRWFIEDLRSSNGTYVGSAASGLPTAPIPVGVRTELAKDDQVYLGAWTRLVVREAVAGEV